MKLKLNEEIKEIPGYEGIYSATSLGRIYSHRRLQKNGKRFIKCGGKFFNVRLNMDGYPILNLSANGKCKTVRVHRLIAKTFIPNPYNLPEINHIDGNKLNNSIENLEWCNHRHNLNHAMTAKLLPYKKASKFYGLYRNDRNSINRKPWAAQTRVNKKHIYIGSYNTEIEAAQAYNNYIINNNLNRPLNDIRI